MISLEELVPLNHIYRKFVELWDFTDIKEEYEFLPEISKNFIYLAIK
jgi:hypothetical protein